MGMPCSTPSAPEFKFEISEDAMQHNLAILEKYDFDLGKALNAQHDSPLGLNFWRCSLSFRMGGNFRNTI